MKAVVLERKGVINVREVPDTPAPAAGSSPSPRIPWGCADPICTITRMGVWANTWSNSR